MWTETFILKIELSGIKMTSLQLFYKEVFYSFISNSMFSFRLLDYYSNNAGTQSSPTVNYSAQDSERSEEVCVPGPQLCGHV